MEIVESSRPISNRRPLLKMDTATVEAARHVVVAVDGSENSRVAILWAATNVMRPEDDLLLVKVLSVPSNVAVETEQAAAEAMLLEAAEAAVQVGVEKSRIHVTSLVPVSTASSPNPGAAIVTFLESGHFKVVVVGSRGLGAVKRAAMAVMGAGSVSSYVMQHAPLPVALVRQDVQLQAVPQAAAEATRKVAIAVDGSPHASAALKWALRHLLDPARDVLHLLAVAVPPPPPLSDGMGPTTTLVLGNCKEMREHATATARGNAAAASKLAIQSGLPEEHIMQAILDPLTNGTGTVSGSIVRHVSSLEVDVLVVGCHGSGTLKSAMLSLIGLGSVSNHCVQFAPCPVVVMRLPSSAEKMNVEVASSPRHVAVAVDGSDASKTAVLWAARNVLKPDEDLHLVMAVLVPGHESTLTTGLDEDYSVLNTAKEAAEDVLLVAAQAAVEVGVSKDRVRTRGLTVSGTAASIGPALSSFMSNGHFKGAVVGSRGMGAFKRAAMALLGTGSVSAYVVQHAELPVAVVRQDLQLLGALQAPAAPPRRVCVAVDGSPLAAAALEWTLRHLLDPASDMLHLLAVAPSPPAPVRPKPLPRTAPGIRHWIADRVVVVSYMEERKQAFADAQQVADSAAAAATLRGVPKDRIVHMATDPLEGGSGSVGSAIVRYVSSQKVDALVIGSRGLSAFKSAMLTLVGLGSVSSECVQHAPCPVIVVRQQPDAGTE